MARVTVYFFKHGEVQRVDFQHYEFNTKCPDNILKIWWSYDNGGSWKNVSGSSIYYFKLTGEDFIIGGINQSKDFNGKDKLDAREIFDKLPRNCRYGIEVSNDIWKKVNEVRP